MLPYEVEPFKNNDRHSVSEFKKFFLRIPLEIFIALLIAAAIDPHLLFL